MDRVASSPEVIKHHYQEHRKTCPLAAEVEVKLLLICTTCNEALFIVYHPVRTCGHTPILDHDD